MMPVFDPLGHETPAEDLEALLHLAYRAAGYWWDRSQMNDDDEPPEAVEVGSWAGRTALLLARTFARVYCVDTWRGNPGDRLGQLAADLGHDRVFEAFCRNMGDHLFRDVIPCRGPSESWARAWPRKVAMVFIDGDHEYISVRSDLLAWRPHVVPGGLIVLHDYGIFPGVTRAVDELIPADQLHRAGHCLAWTTAN